MGYGAAYGLQTLGKGIRDIGAIAGETSRRREEEERAKEQEDYARKRDRFSEDLTLAGMRGGRGAPPPGSSTVMGRTGPTEIGSGLEEAGLPAPLERAPNQEIPEVAGVPYNQERYGVGGSDDDKYYWQRQAWTDKNAADMAEQREARLREETKTRLTGGIGVVSQLSSMSDEGFPGAAAGLMVEGVGDPGGFLKPGEDDDLNEFERAGRYNRLGYDPSGRPFPGAREDGPQRPTVNQVKEDVDEAARRSGSFWNSKNDAERWRYAIAMANGEVNPFADEMAAFDGPAAVADDEGIPFFRWLGGLPEDIAEGFGRGLAATGREPGATRDGPAIPEDEPFGGPSPRSWPRVGPAARPDAGPGTHSVRPPAESATPGSDTGEISRARARVGAAADGQGIPPSGTQSSHNMADQETLDEAWSYLQALPDDRIITHMVDNGWTPSDIEYIQALMDERSQGLREPAPEPLPR